MPHERCSGERSHVQEELVTGKLTGGMCKERLHFPVKLASAVENNAGLVRQ